MPGLPYEIWDVFTERRFAGNPLAVVHDADDLSTAHMQAITREFNLSETVFVTAPNAPGADAGLRIFTPGFELPFAGHPTVGASLSIARRRGLKGALTLDLATGRFAVTLSAGRATFVNPNRPREAGPAPLPAAIEQALQLAAGSVDAGSHRPRLISAGAPFVFARATASAVRDARFDAAGFARLELGEAVGLFLYSEGGDAPDADYHARMFAPVAGIAEDPATGGAAAALPGQIALAGGLRDGRFQWIIEQGVEMGRPSRIEVGVRAEGGEALEVSVGGAGVLVASGELYA